MNKNDMANLLSEFSFKTALHESVDWDDKKLNHLVNYLNKALNEEIVSSPTIILDDILKNFGHAAYLVLKEKFKKTIFKNNLHLKGGDIEH